MLGLKDGNTVGLKLVETSVVVWVFGCFGVVKFSGVWVVKLSSYQVFGCLGGQVIKFSSYHGVVKFSGVWVVKLSSYQVFGCLGGQVIKFSSYQVIMLPLLGAIVIMRPLLGAIVIKLSCCLCWAL